MLELGADMGLDAGAPSPAGGERKGRKASKGMRQLQLIEATIDSLAARGYSDTTLADVADGAGLSRGIVNFHFESKDKLLTATLQFMAEEYASHWRAALDKAGPHPADKLRALVDADFDRKICNKRKLAAWCAFWGEAKSRPTYQALCGSRDAAYQDVLAELCGALIAEGAYALNARDAATALDAALEGFWLRLMLGSSGITRPAAHRSALALLAALFPEHFPRPDGPTQNRTSMEEKQ